MTVGRNRQVKLICLVVLFPVVVVASTKAFLTAVKRYFIPCEFIVNLTLYVDRSSTTQANIASLPTGTVMFVIGSLNLGFSETEKALALNIEMGNAENVDGAHRA